MHVLLSLHYIVGLSQAPDAVATFLSVEHYELTAGMSASRHVRSRT
jgi:hypothetical protein